MADTVRILHVLGGTALGGAESRIMDLYRQMDTKEIQFDFLVHSDAVKRAG
ncbi:MAG: glycosyltransferase family 1 protein, partial [Lachnospiraceae bacterium]|nr:glycosyltransferase family 1 protein [Lachnospiraceae bacterium]